MAVSVIWEADRFSFRILHIPAEEAHQETGAVVLVEVMAVVSVDLAVEVLVAVVPEEIINCGIIRQFGRK